MTSGFSINHTLRDQEDDFRLMILFVAFFLIILGLVSIICVTTCVLGCEADTEHTARDLRHLVHLTKIRSENLCRYFLSNLRYFLQPPLSARPQP